MNEEKIEHFYDKAKGEDCGPAPKMECPQCRGHYSSSMITVRDTIAMHAMASIIIAMSANGKSFQWKEIMKESMLAADAFIVERYKGREEKLTVPHPDYD